MKVIKHGKQYDDDKPFRGKCCCGCVVEVTRKEIRYTSDHTSDQRDGDYYFVICPECDGIIYFKNKRLE